MTVPEASAIASDKTSDSPWLISPKVDGFGILGGVFASYALLFAWVSDWISTVNLVLLWIFVFHGPHFFGTLSRTLLDPTEYESRGKILKRSWLWFLLGPVVVGLGMWVQELTGYKDMVLLFFFFASVWAFHHVIKQHFGFVALYRARSKVFDRGDLLFTRRYLIFSLWAPVIILITNTMWGLSIIPGMGVLANYLGEDRALILQWGDHLQTTLTWLFWAAQAIYVGVQIGKVLRGKRVVLQELLLVLACVSLTWIIVMEVMAKASAGVNPGAAPSVIPLEYAVLPLFIVYHNIQYHCLIWHYNRWKYHGTDTPEKFGWASVVNKNLLTYFAFGLLYTIFSIGLESYGILPERGGYLGEITAGLIWGFSFQHYYLDGHIWHVGLDPNLRKVLRMG